MSAKTAVYRFLSTMRPVVSTKGTPAAIVDALLDRALAVLGADAGVLVARASDTTKTLAIRSSQGTPLSPSNAPRPLELATRALRERELQVAATTIAAPLLLQGDAIGALAIEKATPTPDDADALEGIAAFAATVVQLVHELGRTAQALSDEKRAHGRTVQKLERTKVTARLARFGKLVGDSEPMTLLKRRLAKLCDSNEPVLIRGESGTGKDVVAQLLHDVGPRAEGPYVAINMAAVTESLLESELFGCKKGAFTGATEDRKGAIEAAHGGTLFLDEVAEMSPAMQTKLLRVLQNKELRRLGSTKTIEVDVRIVSATNRDLEALVAEGKFREELYYRLKVIKVVVPPLRDRGKGDLRALVRHFLEKIARDAKTTPRTLSPEALAAIEAHAWPGNVRELENVLRSAVAEQNEPIRREDLELDRPVAKEPLVTSRKAPSSEHELPEPVREPDEDPSKDEDTQAKRDAQRRDLEARLVASSWNVTLVAAEMGVDPCTVHRRIKRLGIEVPSGPMRRPHWKCA